MKRLLLWDIDGTLVCAGETGEVIFDRALYSVVGQLPESRVSMSGKTDPQIVCEYLHSMGVNSTDVLPRVVQQLQVELSRARGQLAKHGRACSGGQKLLARLTGIDGIAQSVLTGNVRANAALKLSVFNLARYLDLETGAYGNDHPDRLKLLPIALRRQAELRGCSFEPSEVTVVGDSPNDLACARASGARCLLVATGAFPVDQLSTLGADAVLADLTDTELVVRLLVGSEGGPRN